MTQAHFSDTNRLSFLRHFFALSCCREISRILNNCEHILFKGPVHAEELYEEPWIRQSGDIDLLVRPRDADKALRLLGAAGFVYIDGRPVGTNDFCANYQNGHPEMTLWHGHAGGLSDSSGRRMPVEVHVSIFKPSYFIPIDRHAEIAEGLFERRRFVSVNGTEYPMPGRTDELVALVHHFAKHAAQYMTVFNCSFDRGGSLPLRYLDEIALYLSRWGGEIDAALAESHVRAFGMAEEFRFAERLLQKRHGLSLPFPIPDRSFPDAWEALYAELNRMDPDALLSPDVYPRMRRLLDDIPPRRLYSTAAGRPPEWVTVNEEYKFAGKKPTQALPLYSFRWAAERVPDGLRILVRIPLWQIDESGSLSLRVQLGGDACCGVRDCLKNDSLSLFRKEKTLQGKLQRIQKVIGAKNLSVPADGDLSVTLRTDGEDAAAEILVPGETRLRIPFNIGLSFTLSRDGSECDRETCLMWTEGTFFPFSCLFLGEIR